MRLLDKFQDKRCSWFGQKIIYQEAPQILPPDLYKNIKSEIARRILSFVSDNQYLVQGERYGLIRFGSRVDIYMPLNSSINCKVGDKVIAGESGLEILAENQ